MAEHSVERRKAQRVDAKLKLEIMVPVGEGEQQLSSLETINISTSGVYFKSDHFIEPMTKLELMLELPVPSADTAQELETAMVPCEGIVVRVTPEQEQPECGEYEVAVFFTTVEPEGLGHLEEHIAMLITTP